MMVKFIKNKVFWVIFFLSITILIIFYVLYFTDMFVLREIRVINTRRVNKNEIIKLTGLKGGERLFRISMKNLRRRILTNRNIEDVIIVRHLPGILEIKVKEREPLAILVKHNRGYLIDKKGVILGSILPQDYFFYPVVEIKNERFKKKLFDFLFWLKNNKNYLPVYENLAKIILTDNKLILITKRHLKIYLPVIAEKSWIYYYRNLDRIMAYLYKKNLIKKIELIRLDYPLGEALIKFRS